MDERFQNNAGTEAASYITAGIMGAAVGDAMGVPVEFESRETLDLDPVTGFREYGTFNQPLGTWSDDTSMTLCLLDSLSGGVDYTDIMNKFLLWTDKGEYTPHGDAFDIGGTTSASLFRYKQGTEPLLCGGDQAKDNGNGSLMRILPAAFYLFHKYKTDVMNDAAMEIVHSISGLTHRHVRSQAACGIYVSIAVRLAAGGQLKESIHSGIKTALDYYARKPKMCPEIKYFDRLQNLEKFAALPRESMKSSGYVIDTLEAALWCLLNTASFQECVLEAVNLGSDTDTTAAVAGGLAGIHYGYASFADLAAQLVKSEFILSVCSKFEQGQKA